MKKNSQVVYTCITGNYDELTQPHFINPNCDYVCFTDNKRLLKKKNLHPWVIKPLGFNKLDNVRNARWHKTNPHVLFPEYESSIWIDANINILSVGLFDILSRMNKPIITVKHFARNCIYEECNECEYLEKDDKNIIIKARELLIYSGMPRNYGLAETNIVFRKHNEPLIIKIDNEWWQIIRDFSRRDQLSFTFVLWKNGINVDDITFANERFRPVNYNFFSLHSVIKKNVNQKHNKYINLFGFKINLPF